MDLLFEWDEDKATANLRKDGVSFDEAVTVIGDAYSSTIPDAAHSAEEERFIDIGQSASGRILVVVPRMKNGKMHWSREGANAGALLRARVINWPDAAILPT